MKRVRAGEYFVIEGLWMTTEEAGLVKQELLARGTKQATRLAQAIGFPSREWGNGSSFDDDARQAEKADGDGIALSNESMRTDLRRIESIATNALANQPDRDEANTRHLKCALAEIGQIVRGTENGESPAGGVQKQVPRNGEAEADAQRVGREAVSQAGT